MREWIEKIPEMYHFTEIVYIILSVYNLPIFFSGVRTLLSSSYNIPGLVPVCWLLFQCF